MKNSQKLRTTSKTQENRIILQARRPGRRRIVSQGSDLLMEKLGKYWPGKSNDFRVFSTLEF